MPSGKIIVEVETSNDEILVEFDYDVCLPDMSVGYRGQIDIGDSWAILPGQNCSMLDDYRPSIDQQIAEWVKNNSDTLKELVCSELAEQRENCYRDE